jgi:hypothetical protein
MNRTGKKDTTDFTVRNEGTIFLLRPLTPQARFWIADNLPEDAMTFGGAIVIEHRYISDIIDGIIRDGLTISRVG